MILIFLSIYPLTIPVAILVGSIIGTENDWSFHKMMAFGFFWPIPLAKGLVRGLVELIKD